MNYGKNVRLLTKEDVCNQESKVTTYENSLEVFSCKKNINLFLKDVHQREETFPCKICDKTFKSRDQPRRHRSYVHRASLFNCHMCGKKEKNIFNIDLQVKSHETKPMYCEEEQIYSQKYELFCFNLQSSDIVMKLVCITDSDCADYHTLTCNGIKAF